MLTPSIQRITGAGNVVVGRAFPCLVEPTEEYIEIHTILEMVGSIPNRAVPIVISVDGFPGALWGGLMSAGAKHRGAVGAVTNGLIRDVDQIERIGFDVFACGTTALDIRRRGAMRAFNVPVSLYDRQLRPGDVVVADGNGVAVLDAAVVDVVAERCVARIANERATFHGLEMGKTPQQVFDELREF